MDFQDQPSWVCGDDFDFNPNIVKCLICRGRNGPNHVTENCPEERVQQILSRRNNSAEMPCQTQQDYFQGSCQSSNQFFTTELSWQGSNWNSPQSFQWENRDDSFQGPSPGQSPIPEDSYYTDNYYSDR